MNRHRNAGRPARAPRGGGRGIGLGFFRALALLIFLVSSGMPTRAAEAPPPEAAKAAALKSVLEGRAFKLYAGDDPVVCLPLLDTLRAGGEAVAFVEPIVRAERYHNPALAPYRAMCPGMELNKESIGTGHSLSLSDLPDEMQYYLIEAIAWHYFGMGDFKLYRLDLDDDPANGEEYLFHAAPYYLRNKLTQSYLHYEEIPRSVDWNDILHPEDVPGSAEFTNGRYTVLDLERCRLLASADKYDIYEYVGDSPRLHMSAVVELLGGAYLLRSFRGEPDRHSAGRKLSWVNLVKYNGKFFETTCAFNELWAEPE